MPKPNRQPQADDIAAGVFPDLPNHGANEAELLAALALGDADNEAGQTVLFEEAAAELRRNYGQASSAFPKLTLPIFAESTLGYVHGPVPLSQIV